VQAVVLLRTGGIAALAGAGERAARLAEASLLALRAGRTRALLTGLFVMALVAAGAAGLIRHDRSGDAAVPQPANLPSQSATPPEERPAAAEEDVLLPFDDAGAVSLLEPSVRLQQETPVTAVAASPDGRLLAAAGTDDRVSVWEVASRQRLARLPLPPPTQPRDDSHSPPVGPRRKYPVLLFPDGRTLAALVRDGPTADSAVWWEVVGREAQPLPAAGPAALLRAVAPSPPPRHFKPAWEGPIPGPRDGFVRSADGAVATVGGSWNGTVPLWDVPTGRRLRSLTVSKGLIHSVVLSPSGALLAAAARDESIRVLDTATGKTLRVIPRPHGDASITTVAFAPDGKTILSGGTDGTACCWPPP
jgi:hypothetical protein